MNDFCFFFLINKLIFYLKIFNIYLFLRERETEKERESVSRGGAEREKDIQNQKQAPGSQLSTQSPTWGSNSWTVRSCPELKLDT